MTAKQFDKLVERLSDQYGLVMQLTAIWLREAGFDRRPVRDELSAQNISDLCYFARV